VISFQLSVLEVKSSPKQLSRAPSVNGSPLALTADSLGCYKPIMNRRTSEPLRAWLILSDLSLTAMAWLIADIIRLRSGLLPIYAPDIPSFSLCVGQLPLIAILALMAFRIAGMYDVSRLRRFREDIHSVLHGAALLALLVVCITFAMQSPYRPRAVLALFPILVVGIVLCGRRVAWLVLARMRLRGMNRSRALVVGTGRLARQTARSIAECPWLGIEVVAHVEDRPDAPHVERPVIGPIAQLPELVNQYRVDHVFLALPMNRYADVRRAFDALSQSVIEVHLVADAPALASLSLTTSKLQGMTIIGLRESGYHGMNVLVKRIMDMALAATALVLLAPVMLVIAACIKATSRGPVFYRQERCSLNGTSFEMLKFRTMPVDAEKHTGPVFTAVNDARRTRLGAVLRATNLDELPQLFNVLRGEMSLVGPRPERPVFIDRFKTTVPNYMARHAVKCGMTGWAQVNGWRGNTSLRRRIQFDLYYITHWNPLFDLRIMVLTVVHMIFGNQKNAY
jgi:Undecaprenyl-phosphate glucose phosphotransferase